MTISHFRSLLALALVAGMVTATADDERHAIVQVDDTGQVLEQTYTRTQAVREVTTESGIRCVVYIRGGITCDWGSAGSGGDE